MKIYTNLNPNCITFQQLYTTLIENYKITLHNGLLEDTGTFKRCTKCNYKEIASGNFQTCKFDATLLVLEEKIIFWFAKSNASKLHYYRITEAIESIYQGLVKIENHKELIK
jgi:hypothetical protein